MQTHAPQWTSTRIWAVCPNPPNPPSVQACNEIHTRVLFGFESIKGLGHTHNYSTSFTHSFQPQAKLPMLQQKVNNEVHTSQHTLSLSLVPRLLPYRKTGREPGRTDHVPRDVLCVVLCVVLIIELLPTQSVPCPWPY